MFVRVSVCVFEIEIDFSNSKRIVDFHLRPVQSAG